MQHNIFPRRQSANVAERIRSSRRAPATLLLVTIVLFNLPQPAWAQSPASVSPVVETRIYDVGDLLINTVDFDQPEPSTTPASQPVHPVRRSREQLLTQLIRKIEDTVAPSTWIDRGGKIGKIVPGHGELSITQTPESQAMVAGLIRGLRFDRGREISIQTSLLGGENLAEKMPVAGKWLPAGKNALRFSEMLSEDQVALLRKNVQANANSTTFTAPRTTLFNGQRAFVIVSGQTEYVAALDPQNHPDGKVTFVPKTKTVDSGVKLDYRATMSPDLKSASLLVHVGLSRLLKMIDIAPPGADPKTGPFYQVPQVASRRLDAAVDVPDQKSAVFLLATETTPAPDPGAPPPDWILLLIKPTLILPELVPPDDPSRPLDDAIQLLPAAR